MDDKQLQQTVSYGIMAIIGYFIIKAFLPFIVIGIIGILFYQYYLRDKIK